MDLTKIMIVTITGAQLEVLKAKRLPQNHSSNSGKDPQGLIVIGRCTSENKDSFIEGYLLRRFNLGSFFMDLLKKNL